jgi:hypothetical protein
VRAELEVESPTNGQKYDVGLLGELLVEQYLVENGWHTLRLDKARFAANADLMAIKKDKRLSLQVKTTNAQSSHSHKHCLYFGYVKNWPESSSAIFNSKESPLIADIIIGVHYNKLKPRYVIMPIGFAENICREHADFWAAVPKKNTEKHKTFSLYLCFTKATSTNTEHHERIMRNLKRFEDKWHYLSESPDVLRDTKKWKLDP